MIALRNVSKSFGFGGKSSLVLDQVSLDILPKVSTGILADKKAGKSTLMRIIAGISRPDSGQIIRDMSVSWPIGLPTPVPAHYTVIDYANLIAAFYGADGEALFEAMSEIGELAAHRHTSSDAFDGDIKGRIAFSVTMALDFDCYAMDNAMTFGGRPFKKRCETIVQSLRGRKAFVIATDNPDTIKKHCDVAYVLRDGQLTAFETVDDAIQFFKSA